MRLFATIVRTSLVLMACALIYQLAVTGIVQAIAPMQANGSLIHNEKNQVIGSALIGQSFTDPKYFQGRVSSIKYDASASGSPNYAPSNPDMIERTKAAVETWKKENPDVPVSQLPIDLITNSASGLDPDISPEAAKAQIPRISKQTGVSIDQLQQLVDQHTKQRELGFLGEPTVNVLELNIALQKMIASS